MGWTHLFLRIWLLHLLLTEVYTGRLDLLNLEGNSRSSEEPSQSLEKNSRSLEKLSESLEEPSTSVNNENDSDVDANSSVEDGVEEGSNSNQTNGESKRFQRETAKSKVLTFKSLDNVIDGIEEQIQLSDPTFAFNVKQEMVLNSGIDKIRKSITDGDSQEKMEIFINELEERFAKMTGYDIEMSFITELRGPTVINEALKKIFTWLLMMMTGELEFSSVESKINAYLAKLKAEKDFNPELLSVLEEIISLMKSKDFEAGKLKLLGMGQQQHSYLPADISSHVSTMEDIIPAAEKECKVTISDKFKSEINAAIKQLYSAIKGNKGVNEVSLRLQHLERKLKQATKRSFDMKFILDLKLDDDMSVEGPSHDAPAEGPTDDVAVEGRFAEVAGDSPAEAVLSFTSLDDLIDGIEAQVQLSDPSFEFTLEQEMVLNFGIDKIRKSITDGDSQEKMEVFITELEESFAKMTGYNIEMSFITGLRGPTVNNEALKKMYMWLLMMLKGTIDFSSVETEITAYLIKLKSEKELRPELLSLLNEIFVMMKSNNLKAGKLKLLGVGQQQQSYLPADISSYIFTMDDIIPAAEKECEVTIDAKFKPVIEEAIKELYIAIKENKGEKELSLWLQHLERKLKQATKRTFDMSFLLDLDLDVDVPEVGPIDWPKMIVVLSKVLYQKQETPTEADHIVKQITVWLRKAIRDADSYPEIKIKLQVLLDNVMTGRTGNLDSMNLLNGFIRILFYADNEDIYTNIDCSDWENVKTQLMKILIEAPSTPDQGNIILFKLRFWIRKALMDSQNPEVSNNLLKMMSNVETTIQNNEDPIKCLATLKEEVEGPQFDPQDWNSIAVTMKKKLSSLENVPADQTINELKVWISKALALPEVTTDNKYKLQVILSRIEKGINEAEDPNTLIVQLIPQINNPVEITTEAVIVTTEAPVVITEAPIPITVVPAPVTEAPVLITEAPVLITEAPVPITVAPVLITEAPHAPIIPSQIYRTGDLFDVNFLTTGGHAHASSTWDHNWLPSEAFRGSYGGWHSGRGTQLPQCLWFVFLEPVAVAMVSFQSRNDLITLTVREGATKYRFWGSNGPAFDEPSTWVILYEDLSGTPFPKENPPKKFQVQNPQHFQAYGFEILETNSNYCTMSNIHFFTVEPCKEFESSNEEVNTATQNLIGGITVMISKEDPYKAIDKITPHLSVILHAANLQQQVPEVSAVLPDLKKEIDILFSTKKSDGKKLLVCMQPLYKILVIITKLLHNEPLQITDHEYRLNAKLLKIYINQAMKHPEKLQEWLYLIRTQIMYLIVAQQGQPVDIIEDLIEIQQYIYNIKDEDIDGGLQILEDASKLCKQIVESLGASKLSEELPQLRIIIKRIFAGAKLAAGKTDPRAILAQLKPWLLLITSPTGEVKGAFTEDTVRTCETLKTHILYITGRKNIDAERYYQLLFRFNIIGWLLKDIAGEDQAFTRENLIEVITELNNICVQYKDSLIDEKAISSFKLDMEFLLLHAINMKIKNIEPKVNELINRIFIILRMHVNPDKDLKDAKSAAMTVRLMIIRLAHLLKITLNNGDFWTKVGGGNYYFEFNDRVDHRSAQDACQEMGGHLARPCRTDLEQLIKYLKKNSDKKNFYIDASDKKNEGFYQYSTGKEMPGEDLWESGQPDNKRGTQHCVAISKLLKQRGLDDLECESLRHYICQLGESEPDPIPQCQKIGDGCYIFDQRKRSWSDAQDECEAMGGVLASPCKKQMKHLLQHSKSLGGRYWIGATDLERKREYTYVKGTRMPAGFWHTGQPDQSGGNEDCVEIRGQVAAINDLNCVKTLPFICEITNGCNEEEARSETVNNCIMIGNTCYIIETQETRSWNKAKAECKMFQSGQLASPDRQQMPLLIDHVTHLGGRYWIGGNDKHTQGSFHYQDGQNMPGGHWINGEPNQCGGSEDCVEIRSAYQGLNDQSCATKLNYICELSDKMKPRQGSTTPECTNFGSSCFWINEDDELSWEEAKAYCESSGGYLASPTSTADTEALLEHMKSKGGKYWIGATDSKKEGKYMYVSGNRMIEGFWVPGEPNQGCGGEEDCIGLWSKKKGFYDEKCEARLRFICQYGEVARQAPEPKECQTFGSGCFIIETSMKLSWNEAKASCESVGAKLAHPKKKQMKALLQHLKSAGDRYWIGGTDAGSEGQWTYVNGDHMPGCFWYCGEPNNANSNEHCVEILGHVEKLNDMDCEAQLAFVCQVEGQDGRYGKINSESSESSESNCEEIGSSCFMIESDEKLTWKAAQKYCEGLGMTLAAPINEDLQILLNHVARIGGRFWIGAKDYGSTFQFLSGSEVPCLWGPGFPEYKEDRKCVEIYAKYKALADGNCKTERNFICQTLS